MLHTHTHILMLMQMIPAPVALVMWSPRLFLFTVLSSHCVFLGDLSRQSDNPGLQVPLRLHRVCRGGIMGNKVLVHRHGFLAGDSALPGAPAPLE